MANKKIKEKKTSLILSVIDYQSYEPVLSEESVVKGSDYVKWGKNNDYPNYIWDTYNNCATLQSVINGSSDYTFGNGIINNTGIDEENIHGDTIEDIVQKIVIDRWIFGGFALQVKYNTLGNIISIAYLDFRNCRTNEDCTEIYTSKKWNRWTSASENKFKAFNPETGAQDGVQIFYYKGSKTRSVYPLCEYNASLISAEIQIKTQNFHYEELLNNFTGSAIVNFNNGSPTEEIKRDTEERLNEKYSGSRNAGRILLSWNESKDKATTIERLQPDNLDTRYKDVEQSSRENIFVSMRANPILFGLPTSTGFADQNFSEAFELFNKTQIAPKQKEIERAFKKIFNKDNVIKFKPFTIKSDEEKISENE